MANTYYAPGEKRSERVQDLFGAIASRYNLINDLQSFGLHRHWKRRMVALSGASAGARALDVCCGTGDIAFRLAAAGAEVTGLDFSPAMLQVAKEIQSKRRLPSVQFLQGDAQNLPFPPETFEIVTVGYGLRNLSSWERGLEEMHRVARPGGRLLVLDFGKPPSPWLRRIYFTYLRYAVPVFGKVFCGNRDAYAYILESLENYPAQAGVERKLQEMKCSQVRTCRFLGGMMTLNLGTKA